MIFGVAVFPGTNCDRDCHHVLQNVAGINADYIHFKDKELADYDCIVLPGGFSYGDYLRPGAIARFTPAMRVIEDFARSGGLVLGICNGFQVLLEAGLLPGSMITNDELRFICRDTTLRVEKEDSPFTSRYRAGEVIRMPVAHADGNYYLEPEGLRALETHEQILLRYAEPTGEISREANPNGSVGNIAGITNRAGNIFGLMPHPERSSEALLGTGSRDGLRIFLSIIDHIKRQRGDKSYA